VRPARARASRLSAVGRRSPPRRPASASPRPGRPRPAPGTAAAGPIRWNVFGPSPPPCAAPGAAAGRTARPGPRRPTTFQPRAVPEQPGRRATRVSGLTSLQASAPPPGPRPGRQQPTASVSARARGPSSSASSGTTASVSAETGTPDHRPHASEPPPQPPHVAPAASLGRATAVAARPARRDPTRRPPGRRGRPAATRWVYAPASAAIRCTQPQRATPAQPRRRELPVGRHRRGPDAVQDGRFVHDRPRWRARPWSAWNRTSTSSPWACRNLAAARRFYVEGLGWKPTRRCRATSVVRAGRPRPAARALARGELEARHRPDRARAGHRAGPDHAGPQCGQRRTRSPSARQGRAGRRHRAQAGAARRGRLRARLLRRPAGWRWELAHNPGLVFHEDGTVSFGPIEQPS